MKRVILLAALLIIVAGDVEKNPGPGPQPRQTKPNETEGNVLRVPHKTNCCLKP